MDEQHLSEELLNFFRALADTNRLKIIGLLAQQSYTVEQLAALLGIGVSTTSHHLSRLAKVGLVEARPDGHYYQYSLQTDTLKGMAQRLLREDTLPRLSQDVDLDAYDHKVLQSFVAEDGSIKAFPAQEKKFLALLRYVAKAFEPGKRYSEKQVNEILARYNEDTALLRRNLVDYKFMGRQGGGGEYWLRSDESPS
ncbi:MAG: metalloregulator ArsR/SmtB family transcription factor [Chloroflexi bacterium]|nr:metalloregulator ArsR/SmtB family transcription factor [Chloroflexota bacterium]